MDYGTNFRAPRVNVHDFSMVPRADIPRSSFRMQMNHKTTFSAGLCIPIFCQEVLPGDTWNGAMTAFVRMATPIYPLMDNLDLESWFFFVPNRLVWTNWYRFMGEQDSPTDSISYSIPQVVSPTGGFAQFSIFDYFGLPCVGQTAAGNTISVSALPLRAYGLIWNQWFRDQNLHTGFLFGSAGLEGYTAMDNGPDPYGQFGFGFLMKRHDYFTACLPWTQKGGTAITLPLGASATVKTSATNLFTGSQQPINFNLTSGSSPAGAKALSFGGTGVGNGGVYESATAASGTTDGPVYPTNLYADLSTATSATINAIRLAFQTQKLLERDARGGTRYTEIIRSHFGVLSPDARLMRPEYLGGGKTPISVAPVPQTSGTSASGTTTPLGQLAAVGTALSRNNGFRYSATEHGYIIGICGVRQDYTYQQGIRRHWSRLTRYDFYFPVFAMLGEKAVYNREIYSDGSANDANVFGYQENWAEYRHAPSYTSGYFRSTNSTPLDAWHLAEHYTSLPTLGSAWIADSTATQVQRVVAAGSQAANQQFLADIFFDMKVARPMPMYSVPGLIDHF